MSYAKRGGIGAELGVFKGEYSAVIAKKLRPEKLYLVDPWWKIHGEYYPDGGSYTDYGRLPTKTAHNAAIRSVRRYRQSSSIEFVVKRSQEFLRSYDGPPFDWYYLDSSHIYEETCEELTLAAAKLAPDGVIMGDDWAHPGVFKAVQELTKDGDFQIIAAGYMGQWAICRADRGHI